MSEVTLLKLGENIIVPIQTELHDRAAMKLQEDILKKIEETGASGLVIDVSAVGIVDSFLGRLLGETAKMASVMGAKPVLVGMKKEVVITLLQLGMSIKNIHTALNIEEGMEFLKSSSPNRDNASYESEAE